MRDFRKILSLILAIAMMLSTGISIMANEPGEEKEYKVNFVLSPDIELGGNDIYLLAWKQDKSSGKWVQEKIKNGANVKKGTRIEQKNLSNVSFYMDGKKCYRFTMPDKNVTLYVTINTWTNDFLFKNEIDKKPDNWVSVTIDSGKGKFVPDTSLYNNYVETNKLELYVNPLREVSLFSKGLKKGRFGPYEFYAPSGKAIAEDVKQKFSKDCTVNLSYEDIGTGKLILHKSKGEDKEIIFNENDTFLSLLPEIRKAQTISDDKRFVCWSRFNHNEIDDDLDEKDINYIYNVQIYDKDYDKLLKSSYSEELMSPYI